VTLIDDLRWRAASSGDPLERVNAGRDRYGPVAAILFASNGYVSVRELDNGEYLVVIWVGDDPVASGDTASPDDIVTTMRGWQNAWSVQSLCDASPYLVATDRQNAVDLLWGVLTGHGEPRLHAIIASATVHPALRALRPWISHGTLHLIHPNDPVGSTRRGVAFLPNGKGVAFQLLISGDEVGPAQDAETAAATAAAAVAAWCTATSGSADERMRVRINEHKPFGKERPWERYAGPTMTTDI
jgi:hypothetical protein